MELEQVAFWALEVGAWDGRYIDAKEAPEFALEVRARLAAIILAGPMHPSSHEVSTMMARAGDVFQDQISMEEVGIKFLEPLWKYRQLEVLTGIQTISAITAIGVSLLCSKKNCAILPDVSIYRPFVDQSYPMPLIEEEETQSFFLPKPYSQKVRIPGSSDAYPGYTMGGINGINTSAELAMQHCEYFHAFEPKIAMEWVHNHSNGIVLDVLETVSLNYEGLSILTSALLKEAWTKFHLENLDTPGVKYLQFCHSQGAVHVRNALRTLPEEVRQRVIVVALAPAAVVPKSLCYDAYNYTSEKDIVPFGEMFVKSLVHTDIDPRHFLEMTENYQELIRLAAHPDATGIDHDLQSPTFLPVIKQNLQRYMEMNGHYV